MTLRAVAFVSCLGAVACTPAALPDPLPASHPANAGVVEPVPDAGSGVLDRRAAARDDRFLPPPDEVPGHRHHQHESTEPQK